MAKNKKSPLDNVTITLPFIKGDTEAVYVNIGDFRGEITRGEEVVVPRYVATWLKNNQNQEKARARFNREAGSKV